MAKSPISAGASRTIGGEKDPSGDGRPPPAQEDARADAEPLLRYRAALVAAGVFWSLGGLFIKSLTINPAWHTSALGITFYRSLFAALWLAPLLRGRRFPRAGETLVSVSLYALLLVLYVASAQGTTAANAILLQYTAPIYAMALGPKLFGEPFRRADLAALVIAMAGMAVLFLGNFHGGAEGALLMGAASGLMFGLFLLWLRRIRDADPVAVTALNNAGVALACGAALAFSPARAELALIPRGFSGEPNLLVPVALLALMGGIQIALPYVLLSYGLKRVPGVEASLLALVEPLLTPLWVFLVVHERPAGATLAGGGLILAALAARYTVFSGKVSGE